MVQVYVKPGVPPELVPVSAMLVPAQAVGVLALVVRFNGAGCVIKND